jgi:hypothetical protein
LGVTAHGDSPDGRGFHSIFREAVLVALVDVLGTAGAKATTYYVDLSGAADVKKVHSGLVEVFGSGAAALESAILRELYSRIGRKFEPEESATFADYVGVAKKLARARAIP